MKKQGGWIFSWKLINGEAQITAGRVENFLKINKRVYPSIWDLRVPTKYSFFPFFSWRRINGSGEAHGLQGYTPHGAGTLPLHAVHLFCWGHTSFRRSCSVPWWNSGVRGRLPGLYLLSHSDECRGSPDNMVSMSTIPCLKRVVSKRNSRFLGLTLLLTENTFLDTWNSEQGSNLFRLYT